MTAPLIALWAAFSMMGAGHFISDEEGPLAWLHAAVAGMMMWGLIGLMLGVANLLSPSVFFAVTAVSALGWGKATLTVPSRWAVGTALLVSMPAVLDAAGPLTGVDELYLHGGLAQRMSLHEGLVGGLLHPNGSRPLTLQIIYTGLWSSGHPSSLSWFHWLLSGGLMVAVVQTGSLHLGSRVAGVAAATLLAGSTTIQESMGQAASDLPTALAVLAAMDACNRRRIRSGIIAAATAMSIKYTSAAPLAGIFLAVRLPIAVRLLAAGSVAMLISPWWIRNSIEQLHPLFPFTGWPDPAMAFQAVEKWGAGRTALDFIWLPYRSIFQADPQTYAFHGRLHPLFFGCLVALPLGLRSQRARPWAVAAGVGCIGWAMGPHWLRYAIPTLPLLALAGMAVIEPFLKRRIARVALVALLFGLAPVGLADMSRQLEGHFQYLIADSTPTDEALQFCNTHLPNDATVALMFTWENAALQRTQILGSVEDHIPSRHFILSHPDAPLAALRKSGATHVLIRNLEFRHSLYPTLDRKQFEAQYSRPVGLINHHLLMGADLLFSSSSHRVYRL